MIIVLLLGILWILYGVAGLLGFQFNPKEVRGKEWTKRYNQEQGVAWLLLGVFWCVLYALAEHFALKMLATGILLVVFALPAVYFAARVDRKYQEKLQNQAN